jgi:hypothetical protein
MVDILHGGYKGRPLNKPPVDEAEHFEKCPACGGWMDLRDLGEVFAHERPLPHEPPGTRH